MASVLPPPSPIHFAASCHDSVSTRSCSPFDDTGTVIRHCIGGSSSPASFLTTFSMPLGTIRSKKENRPVAPSPSLLDLVAVEAFNAVPIPRRAYSCAAQGEDWSLSTASIRTLSDPSVISQNSSSLPQISHANQPDTCSDLRQDSTGQPDDLLAPKSSLDKVVEEPCQASRSSVFEEHFDQEGAFPTTDPKLSAIPLDEHTPFKRWIHTLRDRKWKPTSDAPKPASDQWGFHGCGAVPPSSNAASSPRPIHRKSSSGVSSLGFVTAMKSASITIASLSLYPRSRRSLHGDCLHRRSHDDSQRGNRDSIDSVMAPVTPLLDDEGTWARAIQRCRIVEELVTSEESYVRDMKTLLNVELILGCQSVTARLTAIC
jgi:hypothetical protein